MKSLLEKRMKPILTSIKLPYSGISFISALRSASCNQFARKLRAHGFSRMQSMQIRVAAPRAVLEQQLTETSHPLRLIPGSSSSRIV